MARLRETRLQSKLDSAIGFGALDVRVADQTPNKIGAIQLRMIKHRVGEVGTVEYRLREVGVAKVSTAEIGSG